jgi:hypothetical protein
MTRETWFELPLALRRRWWIETDYSRRPPSDALVRAIWRALGVELFGDG